MPTLLVAHEPASAARVRKTLLADLAAHGVQPEAIEEVLLVASEILANAIRHTAPAASRNLAVSWQLSAASAVIQVSDSSSEQPVHRRVDPDELGGRGLTIVDALSTQWGTDDDATGKRVWARVPLQHDGEPSHELH